MHSDITNLNPKNNPIPEAAEPENVAREAGDDRREFVRRAGKALAVAAPVILFFKANPAYAASGSATS